MSKNYTEKYLGKGISLDIDVIQSQVKFLQGKVLTIIDASFSDNIQRKAIKDLINSAFSNQLTFILQLCYPETDMMTTDEAQSVLEDYDKIVEEAKDVE